MSTQPQLQNDALAEFAIYPFSTDPVFQDGLRNIISSAQGKSPEQLESIIGQAKAFYFARATGRKVRWEDYLEWKESHPSQLGAPAAALTKLEEPKVLAAPLSFQQVTDLIKTGQAHLIPNNKVIPELLHSDSPSESTIPVRRKPWERDGARVPDDSTA